MEAFSRIPGWIGQNAGTSVGLRDIRMDGKFSTDSFTITMEETYTFALSGGVRTQLSERFPEHCYIEMAVPEPTATPTPEPTATPPLPTFTMAPTATPELTATPEPTATLTPTPTPEPTPTPTTVRPTRTLIPTITIAPTLTPVPWETYEHNKDRDQDRSCDTRPNFSVSAPPTWVEGHLRCVLFHSSPAITKQ